MASSLSPQSNFKERKKAKCGLCLVFLLSHEAFIFKCAKGDECGLGTALEMKKISFSRWIIDLTFRSLYMCALDFKAGFPWDSSGYDSEFPMQRMWVQSLVGELRSHMLCSAAKSNFFFF